MFPAMAPDPADDAKEVEQKEPAAASILQAIQDNTAVVLKFFVGEGADAGIRVGCTIKDSKDGAEREIVAPQDISTKDFLQALLTNRSLTSLSITNIGMDIPLLAQVIRTHPSLAHIVFLKGPLRYSIRIQAGPWQFLPDFTDRDREDVTSLAQALRVAPALRTLAMVSCHLNGEILEILAPALKANEKLLHLDLSENVFDSDADRGDKAMGAIATLLHGNSHLGSLDLSECSINSTGLLLLLTALESECGLQRLKVSERSFYARDYWRGAIEPLGPVGHDCAGLLRGNTTLRNLNLAGNVRLFDALVTRSPRGFSGLSAGLADNHTLTHLDVSRQTVDAANVEDFATALLLNRSLESLHLDLFNFAPAAQLQLAAVLQVNSSLRCLDFKGSRNFFESDQREYAARGWCIALQNNRALFHVRGMGVLFPDFQRNVDVTQKSAHALQNLISKNQTLSSLGFRIGHHEWQYPHQEVADGLSHNAALTHVDIISDADEKVYPFPEARAKLKQNKQREQKEVPIQKTLMAIVAAKKVLHRNPGAYPESKISNAAIDVLTSHLPSLLGYPAPRAKVESKEGSDDKSVAPVPAGAVAVGAAAAVGGAGAPALSKKPKSRFAIQAGNFLDGKFAQEQFAKADFKQGVEQKAAVAVANVSQHIPFVKEHVLPFLVNLLKTQVVLQDEHCRISQWAASPLKNACLQALETTQEGVNKEVQAFSRTMAEIPRDHTFQGQMQQAVNLCRTNVSTIIQAQLMNEEALGTERTYLTWLGRVALNVLLAIPVVGQLLVRPIINAVSDDSIERTHATLSRSSFWRHCYGEGYFYTLNTHRETTAQLALKLTEAPQEDPDEVIREPLLAQMRRGG